MKTNKLLLSFFLFFCGPTMQNLEAQEHKPGFFYTITGKGLKDTSYLFGTYHLVNNSYLDQFPRIESSFNKAKGVVVEVVIDSSELQAVQSAGMMTDRKLSDLLDQSFRDSLNSELTVSIGVGLEQLNQMKPMNVTLTLSIVYLLKNNKELFKKYNGMPLDGFFASAGKGMGKSVTPLETLEQQMHILFGNTGIDEQLNGLKAFIRNKEQMLQLGDELVQSWFNHDLVRMNDIYEKTLQLSGEEDKLIRERNEEWMKILPGLLKNESQFIAVGALHLGGKSGLVEQLKQKGYTVTPVKL